MGTLTGCSSQRNTGTPIFFFLNRLESPAESTPKISRKSMYSFPRLELTDGQKEHKVTKFFSCISECTEGAKMYGNFPTLKNCCTAISSSWEACDSSLDSYGCQVFFKERMESFGLDLQKIEISCIYGSAVYDKKFFWIFSSIVTCVTGAVLPRALDI